MNTLKLFCGVLLGTFILTGCGGTGGGSTLTQVDILAGDYSGRLVSTNPLEAGFGTTFEATLRADGSFSGTGEIMSGVPAEVSGSISHDGKLRLIVEIEGDMPGVKSFAGDVNEDQGDYQGSARDDNPTNPTVYFVEFEKK